MELNKTVPDNFGIEQLCISEKKLRDIEEQI